MKKIINQAIKHLWEHDISTDYNNYRLLKEDSLKNAFYYHLRKCLGDIFLDEHSLQIFTEFDYGPLKGTGKRADLAIVKMNCESEEEFLGDCVEEIIAIIELKYKSNKNAVDAIMSDVKKIRNYITEERIDCMYYLGAICETDWDNSHYINDDCEWAKGRVVELVASYDEKDEMKFDVFSHE